MNNARAYVCVYVWGWGVVVVVVVVVVLLFGAELCISSREKDSPD